MRIFFAGSIRGGRNLLPVYIQIIQLLKKLGHTIVSEHVASSKLEETENKLTEEEIFRSDIRFIDECDCLVAEVTIPSTGVGYEICYAVSKGKHVLCIYREGAKVSAMVLGNKDLISIPYVNTEDLRESLALHLDKGATA